MQDLPELEKRITRALDRIGSGLDRLGRAMPAATTSTAPPPPDDADALAKVKHLQEALQTERDANARWEQQVGALKEQQAALRSENAALSAQVKTGNEYFRRLTHRLDTLRSAMRKLRAASAQGSVEARLVDQSMMAEIEGLHALRDADRTELDAVLQEMQRLMQEDANV